MFFGMCNPSQKKASSLRLTAVALASVLLCIALFFLIPSQFAYAEETEIDGVEYTYEVNDDGSVRITGIKSSGLAVAKFPGEIEGKPLVEIDVSNQDLGVIAHFDIGKCTELQALRCDGCGISLDFQSSSLNKLTTISCSNNPMVNLSLDKYPNLESLNCE